jgi:hypothetical protein
MSYDYDMEYQVWLEVVQRERFSGDESIRCQVKLITLPEGHKADDLYDYLLDIAADWEEVNDS